MSNRHAIVSTHRRLVGLVTALVTLLTSLLVSVSTGPPAQAAIAPSFGPGIAPATVTATGRAVATDPALTPGVVSSREVTLTGSRGTRRTFHATVTRSAATLAGYTSPAKGSGAGTVATSSNRFDVFTGYYYYSSAQPIWTYTSESCLSLNVIEWKECMSYRIYYVRNHITGLGVVVWGGNYTFDGLRGARHCHAPGSGTLLARYDNIACGEHRFDPDKTHMKQWDEFEITYNPGPQEVYAFHVNEYANGELTGPYSGLGA